MHFTLPEQPGMEIVPYLEIKPGVEFTSFLCSPGRSRAARIAGRVFPGRMMENEGRASACAREGALYGRPHVLHPGADEDKAAPWRRLWGIPAMFQFPDG